MGGFGYGGGAVGQQQVSINVSFCQSIATKLFSIFSNNNSNRVSLVLEGLDMLLVMLEELIQLEQLVLEV